MLKFSIAPLAENALDKHDTNNTLKNSPFIAIFTAGLWVDYHTRGWVSGHVCNMTHTTLPLDQRGCVSTKQSRLYCSFSFGSPENPTSWVKAYLLGKASLSPRLLHPIFSYFFCKHGWTKIKVPTQQQSGIKTRGGMVEERSGNDTVFLFMIQSVNQLEFFADICPNKMPISTYL